MAALSGLADYSRGSASSRIGGTFGGIADVTPCGTGHAFGNPFFVILRQKSPHRRDDDKTKKEMESGGGRGGGAQLLFQEEGALYHKALK